MIEAVKVRTSPHLQWAEGFPVPDFSKEPEEDRPDAAVADAKEIVSELPDSTGQRVSQAPGSRGSPFSVLATFL